MWRPDQYLPAGLHTPRMATTKPSTRSPRLVRTVAGDLYDQPGHLIRRAHQIALGMYAECVDREVTPPQYAILRMVAEVPGIDQMGLARRVGLDNSTTALTAARLEAKGLLLRQVHPANRRQLQLTLTPEGVSLLNSLVDGVHRMREQLFGVLSGREQAELMRLLRKFVRLNNDSSRAPQEGGGPAAAAGPRPRRGSDSR